jgi:hypothetical protein
VALAFLPAVSSESNIRVGIHNAHFQAPEKEISPPLQGFTNEGIRGAIMVTAVNTTHALRVV